MDTLESRTEKRGAATRSTSVGNSPPIPELLLTTEFRQRLDLVRHLAANSDRIPLVRGVHGVGKSTLMDLLLQQAPADWEIYRLEATPMLQPDQLIYGMCRRFSTSQENLDGVDQLIQRFEALKRSGRLPVIIVDDAEQLPVTTLQGLFGIYSKASGQASRPALILSASPQIDDLLEETRLQFASQKLQVLELVPLNREQSDQLVRHLFKVLEGQHGMPVSDAGYEKIFHTSGGLPGMISQQVEQILRPKTVTPATLAKRRIFLPQLLADVSPPVLIGGGVLALLLLLTLVFEDEINALFEPAVSPAETAENSGTIPLSLPNQPLKVERDVSVRMETEESSPVPAWRHDALGDKSTTPVLTPDTPSVEKSSTPMDIVVNLPRLTAQEPGNRIVAKKPLEQPPVEMSTTPSTAISEMNKPVEKAAPATVPKTQLESNAAPEAAVTTAVEMTSAPSTGALETVKPVEKAIPATVPETQPESTAAPKAAVTTAVEMTSPPSTAALETDKPVEKAIPATLPETQPESTAAPKAALTAVEAGIRATAPSMPVSKTKNRGGTPAPVVELGETKKLEKTVLPEPVILASKSRKPSPAPVQEDRIRQEAWLLKQSPGSYTLQLIGVGDEGAVTNFIQRHRLQGKAAYFRTESNGRPWFPVLYGIYPSRSAAVAARSKLPEALSGQGVWPRSLASIQQAIKKK
ncbi:MAG: SPOR domain-containing protein [Gammaproteobacteria bacterium]|nr:SPOR domain-containing protein [Gammaproteobacteria bacterium]